MLVLFCDFSMVHDVVLWPIYARVAPYNMLALVHALGACRLGAR